MIKKLQRVGNSYGVVIDKPICELLNIDPSTQLEITTTGDGLMIRPVRDPARVRRFREALDKTNQRYEKTLKKLAE